MPSTKLKNASWPIVPLASEVKFMSGGTPTMSESKYWNGDIPWVSSGEMNQRKIHDTSQRVTEEGAKEGSKHVPARTVLAVVRGMSLAKEFRVAITARDVTFNQDLKALIPTDRLFPEFLFYYLLSQNQPIRDSASESAHGTKKLDTQVLEEWPLPLPSVQIQRKIAAVLSAYDELMENNRRRIALLEKLAEELYREWFVRLRFPGHEKVKLVKGVPEGWDYALASKFFGLVKGKSYAGEEITDDSNHMPFISLKSFNRGGGYREDGLKYYSGRYNDEQVVNREDVVIAVTDMTQDRVVVGRAARMPDFGERGAVISLDTVKLVPHNINNTFLYGYMRHSGFADYIKEFANGANVLHLKPDLIVKQNVVMPPRALQDRFTEVATPIFSQVDALGMANRQLTTTRDLLLPRLISGKLRVEDLEIEFPPGMKAESFDTTSHGKP